MSLPRPLKWIGIALGALVALVLVAATVLGLIGRSRLHHVPDLPPALADVPADSATLARGKHLVTIIGCGACHRADLGGQLVVEMPLGRFVAPNLTTGNGGVGAKYRTVADWDHAIRFGVRPDSTVIVPFMPYAVFNRLSDDDIRAMAAYLQQVPPVDNVVATTRVSLLGHVVIGVSNREEMFGDLRAAPAASPPTGTVEEGKYLAPFTCEECHGKELAGGHHPDPAALPGPSLRPYGNWPVDSLMKAVRTGVGVGNRALSDWMPWKERLQFLTDAEVAGIHAYIRSLGAE